MRDSTVAITGANSYLGGAVVRHLLEKTEWRICALVSPRWQGDSNKASSERIRYFQVDLTGSLGDPIVSELRSAKLICHFAWTRKRPLEKINQANEKMIDSLMDAAVDPSRFCFISSVAGTSGAISDYGKAKFQAMNHVNKRGGLSLVCGLVIDEPPQGAFRMLTSCVRTLPVSVRFKNGGPEVYPVHVQDVALAIQKICDARLEHGVYKLFGRGVNLNSFLEELERVYRKPRNRIVLDSRSLLGWVSFVKRTRLAPYGLCEKLQAFVFKEPAELMSYQDIPNMTYR